MTNKILDQCLRTAQKEVLQQKHPEYMSFKHWSFIVQGNKVLGAGKNRSGKAVYNFGYTNISKIHSEVDVYSKTKGILDKSKHFEIVNIRLNKLGEVKLSKPCECCYKFLNFMGCRNIYFSTEAGFARIRL